MKGTIAQIWGRIDPPPGVENYPGGRVGGDISVFISNLLKALIVGAGIKSANDVRASIEFGAVGVAVASDIVTAGDPKKEIIDLASGFGT